MKKRRLHENTFASASPALKNGYYNNLKKALDYVNQIKELMEGLDKIVNADASAPLFTIVSGEADMANYPVLADWFPDLEMYSALESDLQNALAELEPLMEGNRYVKSKITKLVREALKDERDYSSYDRKENEERGAYVKRLKAAKVELESNLDLLESDPEEARRRGLLTVDLDIIPRQIDTINNKLNAALNSPDQGDRFNLRRNPQKPWE